MSKENDLFLNIVANPNFTISDFYTVGLNANNTGLEDEDYYKNNSHVRDAFKLANGDFDEISFHNAYNAVKTVYNGMADYDYNEAMIKQASFNRDNILAPESQKRSGPDFAIVKTPNPLLQTTGVITLGKTEAPKLSIDEIAQTQGVKDPLTNTTTASPNDEWFSYFWDTLVLALWDTDGEHDDPITGEKVTHKKGDLRLNENGTYYYEKLAGRDIYGRLVLNKMNTLTRDGSFWNLYDFFDADDIKQKSKTGTIIKNFALVGSMFIPYVGPWIVGLSVASQSAGFLATLGKMFLGCDSPTLSAIEGWSQSVSRQTAKTQYAQEHTWCWENFINLIGDVAGQLKEQRFVFKEVPALFKGGVGRTESAQKAYLEKLTLNYQRQAATNSESLMNIKAKELMKNGKQVTFNKLLVQAEQSASVAFNAQRDLNAYMRGYNNLGSILSKTYMTGIVVQDTYGEAKQAGATDFEATLLSLGYAAGEYALLSTSIGEHILPELRAEKAGIRAAIRNVTNSKEFANVARSTNKADKISWVKKIFNKGKEAAFLDNTLGTKGLGASVVAHGLGEGIEEVSEELLADFSKSCFNLSQWLSGDDTRISAWDNMFDRYGMSFFGGIIGGGINAPFINYKPMKSYLNMTYNQAMQEIVYMVRNNQTDDLFKTLDKMQIGDKNLSATQFTTDENGNIIYALGTENDNQDLAIKNAFRRQVSLIQNLLESEGANISDESFLDKQTLNDLRYSALLKSVTSGRYLLEFNSVNSEIVDIMQQLNSLNTGNTDLQNRSEASRKESGKLTAEETVSDNRRTQLEEQLKKAREKKDALINGDRAAEYIADSLFEMTPVINELFTKPTFIQYAEYIENKKFDEIPNARKQLLQTDFENWKNTDAKDDIHLKSQIYLYTARLVSDIIKQHASLYENPDSTVSKLNTAFTNLYNSLNFLSTSIDPDTWLSNAQTAIGGILQSAQLFGETIGKPEVDAIRTKLETVLNDANSTEDEKINALQLYQDDLLEFIGNNVGLIIDPFILLGYINSELRLNLNNLLSLIRLYAQTQLDINNDNKYIDLIKNINNYQKLLKVENLPHTPLEELLDLVSLKVTGESMNFHELLLKVNNALASTKGDITQFNLTLDVKDALSEAINVIELYKATINGAKTDSIKFGTSVSINGTPINDSDLYGYNATLNEVNRKQKTKDWENLVEIDSQTANVILLDLDILSNKLLFLNRLYAINLGQKINANDRVALNKDYLIYNKAVAFHNYIPDDWKGKEQLKLTIDSLSTLLENAKARNLTLSQDVKEIIEQERLKLEDAIYDFFQLNLDKLNNVDELAKLINPNNFDLYSMPKELLTEGLRNLDDNSFVWWLAARAAVKSSDFYAQYKSIIDDLIAPIPTQEIATYLNYASVVNGDVFTKFFNAYNKSIREHWKSLSLDDKKRIANRLGLTDRITSANYDNLINRFVSSPSFSNIVLTEGVPGSGENIAVYIRNYVDYYKPKSVNPVMEIPR